MQLAAAIVAAVLLIPLTAAGLYLLLLTVASLLPVPACPPAAPPRTRFAVIVPAHNEELLVGGLLASLRQQQYPPSLFTTYVVADNCTDGTASAARAGGAIVLERSDAAAPGKPAALRWALQEIRRTAADAPDAFIVIDADSRVSPNFLQAMDAAMQDGSRVMQGAYRVENPQAGPAAGIRELAFALVHDLRARAKTRLGLSVGLKGNGMCFAAQVLADGWSALGLAEDIELHLTLLCRGYRVDAVPAAVVSAEMPATLRSARSQNLRWERGRLQVMRHSLPRLLATAVRRRSIVMLDAVIEQAIPSLSLLTTAAILALAAALVSGWWPLAVVGLTAATAIALYVIRGLLLLPDRRRAMGVLLYAPAYAAWKLAVLVQAVGGRAGDRWIRTPREGERTSHAEQAKHLHGS